MSRGNNNPRPAAFTLLEVLVTITIIAVIAVLVAPSFSDDTRLRLMAASAVISSDIEFAQITTIAEPQDPIVVRFDTDQDRYWLAYESDPETPMTRPDTSETYLVAMGQGRAAAAAGVAISTTEIADDILVFNTQGGVEDFTTQPAVRLSLNGQWIDVSIAPSTGTITETDGP